MAGRYAVDAALDFTPALRGIQSIQQGRAIASEKERITYLRTQAAEAYRSGNPDVINEFTINNPEFSQELLAGAKFKNEQTKSNYLSALQKAVISPDQIPSITSSRVQFLRSQGVTDDEMQETLNLADRYNQDPEGTRKMMLSEVALLSSKDEWANFKDVAGISGVGAEDVKFQKTGAFLVRDKDTGETKVAVGSFNPEDGTLKTESATFESFDILSKLGETAREGTVREIGEKRGIKRVEGEETRTSSLIERGTLAAESSAVLRRGLELLETVETGGVDAASLAAKRLFGVEGADEGELSRSLGKAVLAQLRETFGAQFTEREGSRLERLEAGFGKSVANNKRILKQTLKIVERTARRAMKAAGRAGDTETVNDIQDLLEFSLSTDVPAATTETGLSDFSDEDLMAIARGGQ